jgi:hypothetical protein
MIKKMATQNLTQKTIFNELKCDICNSNDIKETREGYVCAECGIVLEIQKLEYYRPYNADILQYATLGTTQIGTKRERMKYSDSLRLEKLNRLHSIKENEETVLEKARIEISRIFNCLNLPGSKKKTVFEKFKRIREGLGPGTKYRSPDKLVPITVYFSMKLQNISINECELLEVSKISKKDFNAFKLQITNFIPQYAERNRKDYILQKILEISEHFEVGMPFFYHSKKILYRLWKEIYCTKDDVIAGLVASITALCFYKDKMSVNAICNKIGIKMSTIQSQVKKNIFKRFKISGFVSLVRSSEVLKETLIKMGVFNPEQEIIVDNEPTDIVEVKLGNGTKIFNPNDKLKYHFYILKDRNRLPLFISLKCRDSNGFDLVGESKINGRVLFVFEILKFFPSKGPPF